MKNPFAHTTLSRLAGTAALLVVLLSGCAPCFKTEPLPAQTQSHRGPLEVVVKPTEDMKPVEVAQLKKSLVEKYELSGFKPVEIEDKRSNTGRSVEIAVMKYEHSAPGNNGCITTGIGTTYVCPLVAPCLLIPGFYHPQFEMVAEVSFYSNGRRVFKKLMSAKSTSSANLINTGDEEFKAKMEDTTVHNFTVAFMKEVDDHEKR